MAAAHGVPLLGQRHRRDRRRGKRHQAEAVVRTPGIEGREQAGSGRRLRLARFLATQRERLVHAQAAVERDHHLGAGRNPLDVPRALVQAGQTEGDERDRQGGQQAQRQVDDAGGGARPARRRLRPSPATARRCPAAPECTRPAAAAPARWSTSQGHRPSRSALASLRLSRVSAWRASGRSRPGGRAPARLARTEEDRAGGGEERRDLGLRKRPEAAGWRPTEAVEIVGEQAPASRWRRTPGAGPASRRPAAPRRGLGARVPARTAWPSFPKGAHARIGARRAASRQGEPRRTPLASEPRRQRPSGIGRARQHLRLVGAVACGVEHRLQVVPERGGGEAEPWNRRRQPAAAGGKADRVARHPGGQDLLRREEALIGHAYLDPARRAADGHRAARRRWRRQAPAAAASAGRAWCQARPESPRCWSAGRRRTRRNRAPAPAASPRRPAPRRGRSRPSAAARARPAHGLRPSPGDRTAPARRCRPTAWNAGRQDRRNSRSSGAGRSASAACQRRCKAGRISSRRVRPVSASASRSKPVRGSLPAESVASTTGATSWRASAVSARSSRSSGIRKSETRSTRQRRPGRRSRQLRDALRPGAARLAGGPGAPPSAAPPRATAWADSQASSRTARSNPSRPKRVAGPQGGARGRLGQRRDGAQGRTCRSRAHGAREVGRQHDVDAAALLGLAHDHLAERVSAERLMSMLPRIRQLPERQVCPEIAAAPPCRDACLPGRAAPDRQRTW